MSKQNKSISQPGGEILDRMLLALGERQDKVLVAFFGKSTQAVSNARRGKVPHSWIVDFCQKKEINFEWLVYGRGAMSNVTIDPKRQLAPKFSANQPQVFQERLSKAVAEDGNDDGEEDEGEDDDYLKNYLLQEEEEKNERREIAKGLHSPLASAMEAMRYLQKEDHNSFLIMVGKILQEESDQKRRHQK